VVDTLAWSHQRRHYLDVYQALTRLTLDDDGELGDGRAAGPESEGADRIAPSRQRVA
jgi:hypothetical protein